MKATDPRSRKFAAKYGTNMQVDVDALDPAVLDRLMVAAAAPFWDRRAFDAVVAEEAELRATIEAGTSQVQVQVLPFDGLRRLLSYSQPLS